MKDRPYMMYRQSWFLKYFFSYLPVLMLPVLLGFVFYYTNITTVKQEIENVNFSALAQAGNELDYISSEMRNIAYHFSGYFADFEGPDDYRGLSGADQSILCQRLKNYEESLHYAVEIVLYLRGDSRLYTSSGIIRYRQFEENQRPYGDLVMSSFFTQLNSIRQPASFQIRPGASGLSERITSYLYPIPYLDVIPKATMCFLFRGSEMRSVLENYLGLYRGNIYLYNEVLNKLYQYENLDLPGEFTQSMAGLRGVGVQELNSGGSRYMLMRSVSNNTGISVIAVSGEKHYYSRISRMQTILMCSIVLLALAGVVIAYWMSMRNYRPLRRLVSTVAGSSRQEEGSSDNEFDFLLEKWNRIEETNLELNRALDRQRPLVAYSFMGNLLRGLYTSPEEIEYYGKCANINLGFHFFAVLIISPAAHDMEHKSLSSQIQMILAGVEEESLRNCRLYSIELILEQQVAVIVNAREKTEEGKDMRIFAANLLAEHIRESYRLAVKIGCGGICGSPLNINASFMEAKVLMEEYILLNKERIMVFEDMVSSRNSGTCRYPVIEQSLFIQSVKQANRDIALAAVDKMIEHIAAEDSYPLIQCLCFDIINMLIKTIGSLEIDLEKSHIKALASFSDLEYFREKVRETTILICDKFEKMYELKNKLLKTRIIDFVNDNFTSGQLSLQQVADKFDISPSYVSRFFKQETGSHFNHYVSMLRVDRAKELLANSDKKVKDIIFEVGYIDAASFLRKFKAQEGITPGQYRERMSRP
jgi:AraC-like DNA-binding protein